MKAKEFIDLLQERLEELPLKEKNDIIYYYDDLITGAIESGVSEEEAVSNLGNIDNIVTKLIDEVRVYEQSNIVNLDFPQKLFKRQKEFGTKFQTINVKNKKGKVVISNTDENYIYVKHLNTFSNKVNVIKNNDNMLIEKTSKSPWIFTLIGIIILGAIGGFLFSIFDKNFFSICLIITILSLIITFWHLFLLLIGYDKLVILLPKNKYYNLFLTSFNSNYSISNNKFNNFCGVTKNGNFKIFNCSSNFANFKSNNGSIICCTESLEDSMNIKEAKFLTYNGTIVLRNMEFGNLNTSIKNGSFKLKNSKVIKELNSKTNNGSIKITDSNVSKVNLKSKSGVIGLKRSKVINSCISEIVSGVCVLKKSELSDIDLKANNGALKVCESKFKDAVCNTNSGIIAFKKILAPRLSYKLNLTSRYGICRVKEISSANNKVNDIEYEEKNKIEATTTNGSIVVSFLN